MALLQLELLEKRPCSQSVFPNSIHLLCSIHKRDNITRKLREFKIEEAAVKQILGDIFGSRVDDACFERLVDSESSEGQIVEWFMQYEVKPLCSSTVPLDFNLTLASIYSRAPTPFLRAVSGCSLASATCSHV